MFRIDQIMSATKFLRTFPSVAKFLATNPEPLLITQRSGRFIVVMDGEFFDGVMRVRDSISVCAHCQSDILNTASRADHVRAVSETT